MAVEQGGGNRSREGPFDIDQIKKSVDLASEKDLMKCAVLKGPPEETILVHCVVLLRQFPNTKLLSFKTLVGEKNGFTGDEVNCRLNNLTVVPALQNGDDSLIVFNYTSKVLTEEGTPLIMLLMGESERTEQEMAVIYVANGMTIARALTALQDMNREANKIKRQS